MIVTTKPFVDIHVHLREPGQTHKETIASGTAAAFHGGFGAVACMPNTIPTTDSPERVQWILKRALDTGAQGVKVYPVACITDALKGDTLTDFAALKAAGAAALSDDGVPVLDDALMQQALVKAAELRLPVLSHCEPETELAERHIKLAEITKTPIHICHVSLKGTIDVIRRAKSRGVLVTAETCPHYFTDFAQGKMNPPLASPWDVQAVIDGLVDGTIDAIVTDHAPHTLLEKQSDNPPNGVIGLETSLAATLTALYHTGLLTLEQIFEKMRDNPARILGIPLPAGTVTIDTDCIWEVQPDGFKSISSNSPFLHQKLKGCVINHVY